MIPCRFLVRIALCCFVATTVKAQSFDVVPLGVKGGGDESNLSSYLVSAAGTGAWICLDAGTLYSGIRTAIEKGSLTGTQSDVLVKSIKGYFISHPHLDHLSGLLLNASDDSSKPIYGLAYTLEAMTSVYFSWKGWVNWSDQGELPRLNKYILTTLQPGKETAVVNTSLFVTAYPLSHTANSQSTAFLIRSGEKYLLYLGDTGSDETEKSVHLQDLWTVVAPLVREKKLHALFIETSYPNSQPDKLLFGHFTPKWLTHELAKLEKLNGSGSLTGLPVVITHMKPSGSNEAIIRNELQQLNVLNLHLIFPEQGKRIGL